jgi:hypothetical protein
VVDAVEDSVEPFNKSGSAVEDPSPKTCFKYLSSVPELRDGVSNENVNPLLGGVPFKLEEDEVDILKTLSNHLKLNENTDHHHSTVARKRKEAQVNSRMKRRRVSVR